MNVVNLDELKQWADIISAVGSTGILFFFTIFFIRGDIVSRKTMETIVSQITENIIIKIDGLEQRRENTRPRDRESL